MAERGKMWSNGKTAVLVDAWSEDTIQKLLLDSKRTAKAYNKIVEMLAAHSSSSHRATTWSGNAWLLFLTHTDLVWRTMPSKSVCVTSVVIVASSAACRQRNAINRLLLALSSSLSLVSYAANTASKAKRARNR